MAWSGFLTVCKSYVSWPCIFKYFLLIKQNMRDISQRIQYCTSRLKLWGVTHLLWECMSLCAGARCIPGDRASPGRRHPPARTWTPCSWPAGAGSAPRAPRSAPRWRLWRRRWPRSRGWWGVAVAGTGFPPPPRPGPKEYSIANMLYYITQSQRERIW